MVTVITKTIGAGGGYDYATFTAAEADVTNIATTAFGSTDLVANDGAIVFEAVAGTYTENVTFQSTLTTDATRQVTYKPAAGSEHGGLGTAGVRLQASSTAGTRVYDSFTALEGIVISPITGSTPNGVENYAAGASYRSLVFWTSDPNFQSCIRAATDPSGSADSIVIENCVFNHAYLCVWVPNTGVNYPIVAINCTAVERAASTTYFVFNAWTTPPTITASNNLCLFTNPSSSFSLGNPVNWLGTASNFALNGVPPALQGSPYPITATTSFSTPLGSGDYAVYMGATGALANVTGNDVWQQGVGPASNPDVPTTDINGVTRSGTSCNPGAFEADGFVAPTVITRTIGAAGPPTYDYASFTLAEAAVDSLGTGTDLTFYNEAIVFEADAGTYSEFVYFGSALTTDATRNVTYKPAAGSEHGGVPGAGVVINASGFMSLRDDYMLFDGMEVNGSSTQTFNIGLVTGATLRNCIVDAATQGLVIGSDAVDIAVENCVLSSNNYTIYPNASSGTVSVSVRNCTVKPFSSTLSAIRIAQSGTATINAEFVNCLVLEGSNGTYIATGTTTVTGSNNFGGGAFPFPVALQGSPYPITATTDTDPGPGDWAIYDAATGALIDDPDNDVLAGGIGPDANPDVPTTDIVGNTRSGATTDPGAFEISTLTPPAPALITIMRQIYQQDASFSVGASSEGVEKITHQLGPASADYFTINSTTSATVSVPRTAHALRIICVVAAKACDVTLDLDASNSVFLGSIGGVASVQTDLTYFWSFGQVVSDGTYPRVRIVNDGFVGDQLVYLWWHLA